MTQSHTHKRAVLSGVYYVDKPENSGDLVFVVVKDREGTVIVFPSWLPHKVPKNTSNRSRVSVSFNAVLTAR